MTVDERYKELYGDSPFCPVEEAIEEIQAGRMVVVVDSPDRENEGDLCMAADVVTPEAINFMATHARGLICLTLTPERCDELGLRLMVAAQPDAVRDRLHRLDRGPRGRSTRASRPRPRPHDPGRRRSRARAPSDLIQPGPRLPAAGPAGRRARAHRPDRGVGRPGAAGRAARPPGVICEVMNEDGTMARVPDLVAFCSIARPEDVLGRRPDRLPAPHREAGRADRERPHADRVRRLRRARLPLDDRRRAPPGAGRGGRGRRRGRARPRPLRVRHRRRLRLAALRLRRTARAGAGPDRPGGPAASCCTWHRRGAASAC